MHAMKVGYSWCASVVHSTAKQRMKCQMSERTMILGHLLNLAFQLLAAATVHIKGNRRINTSRLVPEEIRTADSVLHFKFILKTHLHKKAFLYFLLSLCEALCNLCLEKCQKNKVYYYYYYLFTRPRDIRSKAGPPLAVRLISTWTTLLQTEVSHCEVHLAGPVSLQSLLWFSFSWPIIWAGVVPQDLLTQKTDKLYVIGMSLQSK